MQHSNLTEKMDLEYEALFRKLQTCIFNGLSCPDLNLQIEGVKILETLFRYHFMRLLLFPAVLRQRLSILENGFPRDF